MGAHFNTATIPGAVSRDDVKSRFRDLQEQDRYENGHSYSGGFGMASGLVFENATFDTEAKARDWLDANCKKWEEAIAVTFLDSEGKAAWMIGAMCAS